MTVDPLVDMTRDNRSIDMILLIYFSVGIGCIENIIILTDISLHAIPFPMKTLRRGMMVSNSGDTWDAICPYPSVEDAIEILQAADSAADFMVKHAKGADWDAVGRCIKILNEGFEKKIKEENNDGS
jgi:hypothetical protein